ncbi:hypothetical protein [Sphingosinicella xenopeptidilytica]|uniref:Uncharacterized protein n=1 Tax=Sphingosinicella xenopeptidilytica TaxID=364098 RepID=A0ABW3BX30_SPHXN
MSADAERRHEIKRIVSAAMPGILYVEACLSSIEAAATEFLKDGAWLDGWFAVRRAIQFDGKDWKPEVKRRVNAIEVQLRPSDPHNVAKAYVLGKRGSSFDILDLEADIEGKTDYAAASDRLAQKAEALGRDFGNQNELLNQFLPEALRSDYTNHAFSFGGGLAQSSAPLTDTWHTLRKALVNVPVEERNATILGGFLHQIFKTDASLGSTILDEVLIDPDMTQHLVYLQVQAGIDSDAIERLRKAISSGCVTAHGFYVLTSGVVRSAPQVKLAMLLDELCGLENGTSVALEILHMALYCLKTDGVEVEGALLDIGHQLLLRTKYTNNSDVREHRVQQTIKECYSGPSGEQGARELCKLLKLKISAHEVSGFDIDYALFALFEVQPIIALNEFLLSAETDEDHSIYGSGGLTRQSPLEKVASSVLWSWADQAPSVRYPLISRSLNVFSTKDFDDDNGLSLRFLEGLERSPDRAEFLRSNPARMHPNGWSGHLSAILDRRRGHLETLADHSDPNVRIWVAEQISDLKRWADYERTRESEREETFE